MLTGYARVSATDQSVDAQTEALIAAGCERVFAEKRSGATAKDRPELQACLAFLRPGDVLVVTRLDRLARSVVDLSSILAGLTERGIGFRCLNQPVVDTTTTMGKFMLNILGAVAEFERDMIKERQREGIERAKAAGKYKGGVYAGSEITVEHIMPLRARGLNPAQIADQLGVSKRTVYRKAPGLFGDVPENLARR